MMHNEDGDPVWAPLVSKAFDIPGISVPSFIYEIYCSGVRKVAEKLATDSMEKPLLTVDIPGH